MAKSIIAILAVSVLASCSSTPERTTYEIAAGNAEWLDNFYAAKRVCERNGGIIVQDRHRPDSIRVGNDEPDVGTRYWCASR